MPKYKDKIEMMEESLRECLFVVQYCLKSKQLKHDLKTSPGGHLGFPAAILLFSIADTIGAFHKLDRNLDIKIKGQKEYIRNRKQHFRIFNSHYYNLSLDEDTIKYIYSNYRSHLMHNQMLPQDHYLYIDDESDQPFVIEPDDSGKLYPCKVNLASLYRLSVEAVNKFIGYCRKTRIAEGPKLNIVILNEVGRKDRTLVNIVNMNFPTSGTTTPVDVSQETRAKGNK